MAKGFLLGCLFTLLALGVGAYGWVVTGRIPANADAQPGPIERWAAHHSLNATIAREAPKGAVPMAPTEENLQAGLDLYQTHCEVCHGGADAKPSAIARGLYQHAPQLAHHGVEDDPEGETYWKVFHGIRLTGMPAFGASLGQDKVWQLALFLKHMDALPEKVKQAWEHPSGHF